MAQVDSRPELIIRRYLESQDGPVEAHILHLKETFEIEDLSADNLARVADALDKASIGVEPPLERVPEDGRLVLSLRNGAATQTAEANGTDTDQRSRFARQARFPRRAKRAKPAVKKRQPVKLSEEALAARDAIEKSLLEGERSSERVGGAVAALTDAAANPEAGLAAITDLLPKFAREAERRIKAAEAALQTARGAREQAVERLTGLDQGLGSLIEREGTRTRELEATGKRTQSRSKESEEKVEGARRELFNEIAGKAHRAELKQRFDELDAAAKKLIEARKAEETQNAARERELAAASARVDEARTQVEAALADAGARDQLETRVKALRDAEHAEQKAAAAVKTSRAELTGAIGKASAAVTEARDRLGKAIASEAHESQLRARLELLGDAQKKSVQVFEQELAALTQKLAGDQQKPKELRGAAAQALRLVKAEGGGEGENAVPDANVETAIAANRAALDALRPIDELLQIRAQVAASLLDRLSSAEHEVSELRRQVSAQEADLEERAEALERARQTARSADQRRGELETGLAQRQKELESARQAAEKSARDLAETSKQLKASQAETSAANERAQRIEADSTKRISALSDQLKQASEEAKRKSDDLERQLEARASELRVTRARLVKLEGSNKNLQARMAQTSQQAEEQAASLTKRLQAAEEALKQRGAELERVGKESAQRQERLQASSKELQELKAELNRVTTAGQASVKRAEEAEQKLERSGAELKQARSELDAGKAKLARAEAAAKERENALAEARKKADTDLRDARAKAQAELEQTRAAAKAESAKAAQAARAELEQARSSARTKFDEAAKASQAELAKAQKEAADHKTALDEAKKQLLGGSERIQRAEAQLKEAQEARKRAEGHARELDMQRKQAEDKLREAEEARKQADVNAEKALARFGKVEVEVEELRERLAKAEKGRGKHAEPATGQDAAAAAAHEEHRKAEEAKIAELRKALEEQTAELERVRAETKDDEARVALERQLSLQAAELNRVRRQERVARKQAERLSQQLQGGGSAGPQPGDRRRSKEGQLMEAVDSVRRALLVQMDPDAGQQQPRSND
jgi:chromosome segregation ATPase